MTTRDHLDRAIALCDGCGIDPKIITANTKGADLELATCAEYRAITAAARVETTAPGTSDRSLAKHRIYNALADDLYIVHRCWPHLDCWEDA